jgi:methyl-accepting chemotaxis protein
MGEIEHAGKDVTKVLDVINEIALQTNLLAINASIEAARAGAAGQGFAVVADGVRALAVRSAEAAQETARLVNQTIQTSRHGGEMSKATVEKLAGIGAHAADADQVAERLAAGAEAQSRSLGDVKAFMGGIERASGKAAAGARASAAAAGKLSGQAEVLDEAACELEAFFQGAR